MSFMKSHFRHFLAAIPVIALILVSPAHSAEKIDPSAARVFVVNDPDHKLSPFSGMTRKHWIECGRFMLEGAFQHVKSIEDPMLFPKVPGISYPKEGYEKCPPEQRRRDLRGGGSDLQHRRAIDRKRS